MKYSFTVDSQFRSLPKDGVSFEISPNEKKKVNPVGISPKGFKKKIGNEVCCGEGYQILGKIELWISQTEDRSLSCLMIELYDSWPRYSCVAI